MRHVKGIAAGLGVLVVAGITGAWFANNPEVLTVVAYVAMAGCVVVVSVLFGYILTE